MESCYISVCLYWYYKLFDNALFNLPFMYNMTTWDTAPNSIVHIQQGYRPRLYDIYLSKDRFSLHSPLPSPHKLFYLVFYNILHKFILWISAQLYNHIFWNLSECRQEIHQNILYRLLNSIQLIVETERKFQFVHVQCIKFSIYKYGNACALCSTSML